MDRTLRGRARSFADARIARVTHLHRHGNDVPVRRAPSRTNSYDHSFGYLGAAKHRRGRDQRQSHSNTESRSMQPYLGRAHARTLETAESGRMTPPIDFLSGSTFSTSTRSRSGMNFLMAFDAMLCFGRG